jgi:hypothetical protein
MRRQRICCRASALSRCQRWMVSVHFIEPEDTRIGRIGKVGNSAGELWQFGEPDHHGWMPKIIGR